MGAMNLDGRRPRVSSPMSNGIVWLSAGLAVLFAVAVILGFRTRLRKKEQMTQVTVSETVAHDAALSNRTQVRSRAEEVTPVSALVGTGGAPVQVNDGTGVMKSAANALTGAVKTDAHPFPDRQPLPGNPNPYSAAAASYYQVPQNASYAQYPPSAQNPPQYQALQTPGKAPEDPALRERDRTEERHRQAIEAPTGIVFASARTAGPVQKSSDPVQTELDRIAQLGSSANFLPGSLTAASAYPPVASAAVAEEYDANQQNGKRKFQREDDGDYLKTTRVAPISPWVVERGDKIVAILPARIVSDLPGDLVAEVKTDVYDSPTHKYILIPAGSLLAGEYNSSVSYGQGRVQVIWNYLRFPDGSFINLGKFVSHAAEGGVGLKDQTDNHIGRLVGGVLLSSVFAAAIQISQNRSGTNSTLAYPSPTQVAGAAIGQQAGQLGEQVTSRNLNVQPTLKIRTGEPFYVSVQKSMVFPGPYEPFSFPAAHARISGGGQ